MKSTPKKLKEVNFKEVGKSIVYLIILCTAWFSNFKINGILDLLIYGGVLFGFYYLFLNSMDGILK